MFVDDIGWKIENRVRRFAKEVVLPHTLQCFLMEHNAHTKWDCIFKRRERFFMSVQREPSPRGFMAKQKKTNDDLVDLFRHRERCLFGYRVENHANEIVEIIESGG